MTIKAKDQKCTIPKVLQTNVDWYVKILFQQFKKKNTFIIHTVVEFEIRVFSGTSRVCQAIEDS